ncbi:TPA: histidine phosphatase family protein, partial [Listeria monocytogenes]
MKLVLIRHGQSEWNKLNLFTGWHDVDLSQEGVVEAMTAGKRIKEAGLEFDVAFT